MYIKLLAKKGLPLAKPRFIEAISRQEFAEEIDQAWPTYTDDRISIPDWLINSEAEFLSSMGEEDFLIQIGLNNWEGEDTQHLISLLDNNEHIKRIFEAAADIVIENAADYPQESKIYPIIAGLNDGDISVSLKDCVKKFSSKYGAKFLLALEIEIGTYYSNVINDYEKRTQFGEDVVVAQNNDPAIIGHWFIHTGQFLNSEDWGNNAISLDAESILFAACTRTAGEQLCKVVADVIDSSTFFEAASITAADVGNPVEYQKIIFEYFKENVEEVIKKVRKDNENWIEEIFNKEVEYQAKWRMKNDLIDDFKLNNVNTESTFFDIGNAFVEAIKSGQIDISLLYENENLFDGGDFSRVHEVLENHSQDEIEMPQVGFNPLTQQIDIQPSVQVDDQGDQIINAIKKDEDEFVEGDLVSYKAKPAEIIEVGDGYKRYKIIDENKNEHEVEKPEIKHVDTNPLRLPVQAASGTGYADYQEKDTDSAGTGVGGSVVSSHSPDVAQQTHGNEETPIPSKEYEESMKRNRDIQTRMSLANRKIDAIATEIVNEINGRLKNAQVNISGDNNRNIPVPASPLPMTQQVAGQPIGGNYSNNEQQQQEENVEQNNSYNLDLRGTQNTIEFQKKMLENQQKQVTSSKIKMIFGTTPNFENPNYSNLSQIDDDNSQLSGTDHGRKVFLGEKYTDDDVESATFPKLNKDLQPKK